MERFAVIDRIRDQNGGYEFVVVLPDQFDEAQAVARFASEWEHLTRGDRLRREVFELIRAHVVDGEIDWAQGVDVVVSAVEKRDERGKRRESERMERFAVIDGIRDDSFPGPKPLKLSADAPCRSCVWRDAEGCCCLMFLMWFRSGWKKFQRVILSALKKQGRDIPIVLNGGGGKRD